MEFKGSKGKWFIDGDKWIFTDDKSEYGDIICAPPEEWDLSMINWEANALLISKAPEMLEMLDKAANKLYSVENPSISCRILADEIMDLINEATTL